MDRPLLDRWTDTTVFRFVLLLSAVAVLPVLGAGVLVSVIGGGALVVADAGVDLVQAVFGLLSVGGVLGFIGYARARSGARNPDGHNFTATMLCLAAGVVAALSVATYTAFGVLEGLGSPSPWGPPRVAVPTSLFSVANVVWAVAGVAWMQRLPHRYAEETGRAFDSVPVMLLFVAIALTIAAALATTTL